MFILEGNRGAVHGPGAPNVEPRENRTLLSPFAEAYRLIAASGQLPAPSAC
jgi:hypothetical protein